MEECREGEVPNLQPVLKSTCFAVILDTPWALTLQSCCPSSHCMDSAPSHVLHSQQALQDTLCSWWTHFDESQDTQGQADCALQEITTQSSRLENVLRTHISTDWQWSLVVNSGKHTIAMARKHWTTEQAKYCMQVTLYILSTFNVNMIQSYTEL